MITTNDVISFIENLIKSNIDFCAWSSNEDSIYNIGIYNNCDTKITIRLWVFNNSITIERPCIDDMSINNISKIDMLNLQRVFIKAEEHSNELAEYKFRHYFDKMNEIDKTIDNLDDDED